MLAPVVREGQIVAGLPSLDAIRSRCREQTAALPDDLRGLDATGSYPVSYGESLEEAARKLGL